MFSRLGIVRSVFWGSRWVARIAGRGWGGVGSYTVTLMHRAKVDAQTTRGERSASPVRERSGDRYVGRAKVRSIRT